MPLVVTELLPLQICYQDKVPTHGIAAHSQDVANPILIGQTSLHCSSANIICC